LGSHHSLETREKMRQAKLGKAKSMTACANMRRAHREKREYSKIFTLEVRQRMSEAAKKRVLRDGMACLIARSIRVPRYVGTKESYHAQ
jgi:hypothetical protein